MRRANYRKDNANNVDAPVNEMNSSTHTHTSYMVLFTPFSQLTGAALERPAAAAAIRIGRLGLRAAHCPKLCSQFECQPRWLLELTSLASRTANARKEPIIQLTRTKPSCCDGIQFNIHARPKRETRRMRLSPSELEANN